jgi:tetratricopeptide (TPR) repeat protein
MKRVLRVPIGLLTVLVLMVYLATSSGCSSSPQFAAPPVPENYDALEPVVVDLIQKVLEQIDASDGDSEPMLRLCTIYQANDLEDLASICYQLVVDVEPDQAQAWYQLARLKAQAGDREGAVADMTQSIEAFPHYPPAYTRKARLLLEGGDAAAAKVVYEDALQIDPQNVTGRIGLVRVYIQQESSQEAVDLLNALLVDDPDNGYLYLLLGNALRQLGRMDEAAVELAKGTADTDFVRDDPWASDVLKYQMSFNARLQMAYRYQLDGQLEGAIALYERLYQENPEDVWVLCGLGQCYLAVNRPEDALAKLLEALEHNPDSFKVHFELSAAYHKMNRGAEAIRHVNRSLELQPESAKALARRGQILLTGKLYEEAIVSFEKSLDYATGEMRSHIYSALGDCHARLGRWQGAVENYNEAVVLDNHDPRLLAMLGMAAFETGDYDLAEQALQRALQMSTDHPQAIESLLAQVRSKRDS